MREEIDFARTLQEGSNKQGKFSPAQLSMLGLSDPPPAHWQRKALKKVKLVSLDFHRHFVDLRLPDAHGSKKEGRAERRQVARQNSKRLGRDEASIEAAVHVRDGRFTVWADGACHPNPGPGGWAFVMRRPDNSEVVESGVQLVSTSNRAEMFAVLHALRAVPDGATVHVYSDSDHVVKGLTSWHKKWVKNGWVTQDKTEVINRTVWELLLYELQRVKATIKWVKGHGGNEGNERADALAKAAARKAADEAAAHGIQNQLILDVDFHENPQVKSLGAKFNGTLRRWCWVRPAALVGPHPIERWAARSTRDLLARSGTTAGARNGAR